MVTVNTVRHIGGGTVIIEDGEDLTFTDDGEGNITIEEAQNNG